MVEMDNVDYFSKDFVLLLLKLPLDIQLSIFKYLPRQTRQILLTEVPVLYDTLVLTKSLWDTLELDGMMIKTGRACKLLSKSPYYTKVVIKNRNDLNKLLKMLIKSHRVTHITSLSFIDCEGSTSKKNPLVNGGLLLKLIESCPNLSSFELSLVHVKSLQLFQYLGNHYRQFQFIYSNVKKAELVRFLTHVSHDELSSMLVFCDDVSISGREVISHILDTFQTNGAFMIENDNNLYKISVSSDLVLDYQNHYYKLQKKYS